MISAVSDYDIYQPDRKEKMAAGAGFALLCSFCGYIFYGTLLWGLMFPFLYPKMLYVYCRFRAERRKRELLGQFRDLLFSLSASFSTGRHMEEAMEEALVRETGGDLVFAVNKAAAVIGDKIAVEGEIKTMISQKKLEGRLITAMPVFIVLFLQMTSPDYLAVMYGTFAGRILMTLALSATVLAYVMIERITAIEV